MQGTQIAEAFSSTLTDGLEPGALLGIVVSGLGLFLLSRLGGIPVPAGPIPCFGTSWRLPLGIALYVTWMGIQLLQYVTVASSLLLTGAARALHEAPVLRLRANAAPTQLHRTLPLPRGNPS